MAREIGNYVVRPGPISLLAMVISRQVLMDFQWLFIRRIGKVEGEFAESVPTVLERWGCEQIY